MTRLIDADSIPWDVEGVGEIPVITKEEIEQMPTVDAEPVIRCKDCIYYLAKGEERYCHRYGYYGYGWKEDDFCSRAERKEE